LALHIAVLFKFAPLLALHHDAMGEMMGPRHSSGAMQWFDVILSFFPHGTFPVAAVDVGLGSPAQHDAQLLPDG